VIEYVFIYDPKIRRKSADSTPGIDMNLSQKKD
jgi:hypothetical protein